MNRNPTNIRIRDSFYVTEIQPFLPLLVPGLGRYDVAFFLKGINKQELSERYNQELSEKKSFLILIWHVRNIDIWHVKMCCLVLGIHRCFAPLSLQYENSKMAFLLKQKALFGWAKGGPCWAKTCPWDPWHPQEGFKCLKEKLSVCGKILCFTFSYCAKTRVYY